jgi:hypothetical protein
VDDALPIITLILGLGLGYLIRLREFRRDKRLQIYGDFVGSFLAAIHSGAVLHSMHTQLGRKMFEGTYKAEADRFLTEWARDVQAFEADTARLRMVGSESARQSSERLEEFITANIRHVPPLRMTDGADGWGESAKVGPAKVEADGVELARAFADSFASEIIGRRRR